MVDYLAGPWCGQGVVMGNPVEQTINWEWDGMNQLLGTGRTTVTVDGIEMATEVVLDLEVGGASFDGHWEGDDGISHDFTLESFPGSLDLLWTWEHEGLGNVRVEWRAEGYTGVDAVVYFQDADGNWVAQGRLFSGGACSPQVDCPTFDVCSCSYVCEAPENADACPWDCSSVIADLERPSCEVNDGVCVTPEPFDYAAFMCEPVWDQCLCKYRCPDPLEEAILVENPPCENECPDDVEYVVSVCEVIDGVCQSVDPP